MAVISFSRRLHELAEAQPDAPSLTVGDTTLSRAELVRRGDDLAVHFAAHGVGLGDMVTVAVPNSVDWFVAYLAIWRLGAIPQPISWRLPPREFDAIMELADPKAVVGVAEGSVPGRLCIPAGFVAPPADASHLPDAVSPAWKAPTSGGSTGRRACTHSGASSIAKGCLQTLSRTSRLGQRVCATLIAALHGVTQGLPAGERGTRALG